MLHGDGLGVPQNPQLSMRWSEISAGSDLAIAQQNWGEPILKGLGTPKNYVHAYVWLSEAAKKGDKEARKKSTKFCEEIIAN